MEKDNQGININQPDLKSEKEAAGIPGAAHSCCGKCRQKNRLQAASCKKNVESSTAALINNETTIDGGQPIIQTVK